jgi:NADPH-dependent curcumin reductase CurA
MKNRRIVLAQRPAGEPTPENFRLEETDMPAPREGEVLLRTRYLSLDPYMRGRMSEGPSYAPPTAVGEVMPGGTVSEVVGTGDLVLGYTGWQEYATAPANSLRKLDPAVAPVSTALGVLGMPGLTAYFGLLKIGQPKPGETVVVSAASGAVGSVVGQIAKLKGCRTVGIAGGRQKCDYVVNELGLDACADHRSAEFARELEAATPAGIDVYFENVGGKVLETIRPRLNNFARVPVCGLIAQYNMSELPPQPDRSPLLLRAILTKRLLFRGFIVGDFASEFEEAYRELATWVREGRIKYREDIVEGLDQAVPAFLGLLKGRNFGKLLVRM